MNDNKANPPRSININFDGIGTAAMWLSIAACIWCLSQTTQEDTRQRGDTERARIEAEAKANH